MSIYEMAKKKHIVPTRTLRWCCAEYKEFSGSGKVTLIGIRKQESERRAKRNEVELSGHKFSGTFDQWEEHEDTMVTCVGGRDKILVSPIIYWTEIKEAAICFADNELKNLDKLPFAINARADYDNGLTNDDKEENKL